MNLDPSRISEILVVPRLSDISRPAPKLPMPTSPRAVRKASREIVAEAVVAAIKVEGAAHVIRRTAELLTELDAHRQMNAGEINPVLDALLARNEMNLLNKSQSVVNELYRPMGGGLR